MKVMVVSDTHKKHDNLLKALKVTGPIDLLIHLGDAEGCEDYIESIAGCPVEIVKGNNDYFTDLENEKEIKVGKYNVLITHGHYYYVTTNIENIKRECHGRGMDIVMFGHTHIPIISHGKEVIAMNPGSISYPRQDGRKPSYIIMEIDRKGEAHFNIHYVST